MLNRWKFCKSHFLKRTKSKILIFHVNAISYQSIGLDFDRKSAIQCRYCTKILLIHFLYNKLASDAMLKYNGKQL